MTDLEDAIRHALHADAELAPEPPEAFHPGTITTVVRASGPRWRTPLVGAAVAALLLVAAVWLLGERSSNDVVPPAGNSQPTTASVPTTNFHLALTAPGWRLTAAQINTDEVSSSYRNDVGDDESGGPSVAITTGTLDPLDESALDRRSDIVVDGSSATLLSSSTRQGLAFIVIDLGGSRSARIDLELVDDQIPAILAGLHFVDQNELEALALDAGFHVQRVVDHVATAGSTGT